MKKSFQESGMEKIRKVIKFVKNQTHFKSFFDNIFPKVLEIF